MKHNDFDLDLKKVSVDENENRSKCKNNYDDNNCIVSIKLSVHLQ